MRDDTVVTEMHSMSPGQECRDIAMRHSAEHLCLVPSIGWFELSDSVSVHGPCTNREHSIAPPAFLPHCLSLVHPIRAPAPASV